MPRQTLATGFPRRPMTPAMQASLESERKGLVYFYQFQFGIPSPTPGVAPTEVEVLLCSAAHNVTVTLPGVAGSQWQAIGGKFEFEPIPESSDLNAAQVRLILSGVNQVMIAQILQGYYLGRPCRVWLGHRDPVSLELVASPILLFRGYQNGGWEIKEERSDSGEPHGVTVSLRAVDRLADLELRRGIQTNLTSHQKWSEGDQFFDFVPALIGRTIKWG